MLSTTAALTALLTILGGCWDLGPDPAPTPGFTIQFIQRLPEISYRWETGDPPTAGWPAAGEVVTWRAHIRNWENNKYEVKYLWSIDGENTSHGTVTLAENAVTTVDLPWEWTFDRHELNFVIDPENEIDEFSELNNELTIYTDALSIQFWVEESISDFFSWTLRHAGGSIISIDGLLQGKAREMNLLFENAVYPETPSGVLDRVRIDEIVVVSDGFLEDYNNWYDDHTADMVWTFHAAHLQGIQMSYQHEGGLSASLLHKLGHARQLTDVFRWDLFHKLRDTFIAIEENGQSIIGEPYLPVLECILNVEGAVILHETPEQGLMNRQYDFLDRYSAVVLNRHPGLRQDAFLQWHFRQDLPAENELKLVDGSGSPHANADVEVYAARLDGESPWNYDWWTYFDDVPDFLFEADGDGVVRLGTNPFGCVADDCDHPGWEPRRHVIVRVELDGKVGYGILESRLLNLEYWRGNTELGRYDLEVVLH